MFSLNISANIRRHHTTLPLWHMDLNLVTLGLWHQGAFLLDNLLGNLALKDSWYILALLSHKVSTDLFMNLLLESPQDPAAFLNIHGDAFLLRSCSCDKSTLSGWFIPTFIFGNQLLLWSGDGDTNVFGDSPINMGKLMELKDIK